MSDCDVETGSIVEEVAEAGTGDDALMEVAKTEAFTLQSQHAQGWESDEEPSVQIKGRNKADLSGKLPQFEGFSVRVRTAVELLTVVTGALSVGCATWLDVHGIVVESLLDGDQPRRLAYQEALNMLPPGVRACLQLAAEVRDPLRQLESTVADLATKFSIEAGEAPVTPGHDEEMANVPSD